MSNTKIKIIDSDKLEQYADMFKALSNYNRLRIFLHTLGCYPPGETCVAEAGDISAGLRAMAQDLGLAPSTVSHHLKELRNSVAEGRVPPLIRARVQASDGELKEALRGYLRTDPASWTGYDVESLRRIGTHQGLSADLRRLISGALASGRVQQALVAPLREVARGGSAPTESERVKSQLRKEIEAQTPAGQIAIESAKRLINDRSLFLGQKYAELIAAHRESEPVELSTETVLLLFLSAVELEEQIEMDRWGQELKRRHAEVEVRDWVNEVTATTR